MRRRQYGLISAALGMVLIFFASVGRAITVSSNEETLASLILNHPEQARTDFQYSSLLHFVARYRAEDMARRNYAEHVNPEGFGPNVVVDLAGYILPSWYMTSMDANYIESLTAGYATPSQAFAAFMESEAHREHLLGLSKFFADQTRYGIGYAHTNLAPYRDFWIVITAPPAPYEDLRPYTEWRFSHLSLQQMVDEVVDPQLDTDGDGMLILEEYVHGYDPNKAEEKPKVLIRLDSATGGLVLDWPVRSDLDPTIEVLLQETQSMNPAAWRPVSPISQDGTTPLSTLEDSSGFYRFSVRDTRP
jgi:hypothetical protein